MTGNIRISCSVPVKEFNRILTLVFDGQFSTCGEYLRYLIIADMEQKRAVGVFDAKEQGET